MEIIFGIIGLLLGVGAGIALAYTLLKNSITKNANAIEEKAKETLKKAEEDGERLKKTNFYKQKRNFSSLKASMRKW